jgi:phosphatidylserine decarboxylase
MSLFVKLQHVLPQHLLSRVLGFVAQTQFPPLKNFLIEKFIRQYQVDMNEAVHESADDYQHFNDFFTRELKPGLRPIKSDKRAITCPADGCVSQSGKIENETLFQAKGHSFSCSDLLGGDKISAELFRDGRFATIYLSPKDYHRVHMPLPGKLRKMTHIPGRLFSVNTTTTAQVPSLFARNERVACIFETPAGPIAMILVGAMIVASIETVWAGTVTPPHSSVSHQLYGEDNTIELDQGAEMGRFKLGSTVIVLLPNGSSDWLDDFKAEKKVKMGEAIGRYE